MEMARFALSTCFQEHISRALSDCGIEESSFTCEPEAKTSFGKGMGRGESRNHDLLMVGENTLIGVEAKVSEPYDVQIKAKRNKVKDQTRINKFIEFLYGNDTPDNVEDLYYQLFSATVGSIKEAERRGINNVIVLVIVFKGRVDEERDYCKKVSDNNEAFAAFCDSLHLKDNQYINLPGSPEIKCWIKKTDVFVNSSYDWD